MSERLYIGIDLGTYQSTVMSSEGVQTTIETVVGRPKDPVARNFLGRDVVFGEEAIKHRLACNLFRPLEHGVAQDDEDNLSAAKAFVTHLIENCDPEEFDEVLGVICSPSHISFTDKTNLVSILRGLVNGIMVVSEPFAVAFGLDQIAGSIVTNAGSISMPGHSLASKKDFDISHPTKEDHRLRHVCLEGPEAGVYVRGRLTDNNVIELPEYWRGLVDPSTITVTLTQIRTTQDLIVDAIEWGTRVKVRSGNASKIDCFYLIHAERADGEKLIPEYEGTSIEDYPGDNSQYSHDR